MYLISLYYHLLTSALKKYFFWTALWVDQPLLTELIGIIPLIRALFEVPKRYLTIHVAIMFVLYKFVVNFTQG